jgi:hypothetical protein
MENKFVKIKYYNSIAEAELERNILKDNGIQCYVNRMGVRYAGDMGDMFGGDLFVTEADFKKSKEILNI